MNTLRRVVSLLSPRERRQMIWLVGLSIVMALVQVAGIASISPFLAVVSSPDIIQNNDILRSVYESLGFETESRFMVFLGVAVLVVFTATNALTALTTWLLLRFSWMRNYSLSKRLLEHYLRMPYVFFLNRNSADLSKNVLAEVKEVISGILGPSMQIIAKSVAALAIVGLLLVIDPLLAIVTTVVLGGAYGVIFLLVRRRLKTTGIAKVASNRRQYQAAGEALSGIKDIKLLGKEQAFLSEFSRASKDWANHKAAHDTIAKLPHLMIETLAFGGMLLIIIYLLVTRGELSQVVPIVGLYAFASYRLLPALKDIFGNVAKVRFYSAALDEVDRDFQQHASQEIVDRDRIEAIPVMERVELDHVTFTFPGSHEPVLRDFSIRVRANSSIALVGETGSGKTTTVDLLLGLLEPDEGRLLVDGVPISGSNRPAWQKGLGYVPQHIYLSDDTIANNIAFGIVGNDVDMEAVRRAARIAEIHDFISTELDEGYDTVVGERGVRLSGGQRQRIGIARALYHDPSVLILDEATSALDGITEERIFRSIRRVRDAKTSVMIAHRLSTVRHCDTIYLLDHGRVADHGTYDELLARSPRFRAMAQMDEADEPVAAASD